MPKINLLGVLIVSLGLVSCSGGGGSSSGSATTEQPVSLSFSPATLSATQALGGARSLTVQATSSRTISGVINIGIIDNVGVINPSITLIPLSETTYQATLSTSSALTAGKHTGTLEVRLCRDTPTVCNSPIPGSPWMLPYEFTVSTPTAVTSPSSIQLDIFQGEQLPISVNATISNVVSINGTGSAATVYPQIVDPTGVFSASTTQATGLNTTSTQLIPQSLLAPGAYTGSFELRLCKSQTCTQQYDGSPLLIPYSLNFRSASTLSPLSKWTNANEWSQHQGNAAHTGYVPVIVDFSKFNRRWKWSVPSTTPGISGISPVVTDNNLVYVMVNESPLAGSLYAISENDKTVVWTHYFGPENGHTLSDISPIAVSDGKVSVASSYVVSGANKYLWSLNGLSGAVLFQVPMDGYRSATTLADGEIYTTDVRSFSAATGVMNWLTPLYYSCDYTALAADTLNTYILTSSGLQAFTRATGASAFTIVPTTVGSALCAAPALGSNQDAIALVNSTTSAGQNSLINFDLAGRSVKWSVPTSWFDFYAPAVANGIVYIVNTGRVEARAESDGHLMWAWSPDQSDTNPFSAFSTADQSNLVVTDNVLFVSSNNYVYAISLDSHQVVWNYPLPLARNYKAPARLTVSPNGILYIVESDQSLAHTFVSAFNLK